jgi:hypothetical protein
VVIWERFGLLCMASELFGIRDVCGTAAWLAPTCSALRGTGVTSAGLVCGVGDACCCGGNCCCCCMAVSSGAGGAAACASNDALVRLLRVAGSAVASLGSAGLRGFRVLFSGAFGSLGLGLGPGFLRIAPDAVNRGVVEVAEPGGGVLVASPAATTPLFLLETLPMCSGERGGGLRLLCDEFPSAILQRPVALACAPIRALQPVNARLSRCEEWW